MSFVELSATSNFTFLTGASHPEELMTRAQELALPGLAIADENSVAGIVRAHTAAREITRTEGSSPRLIPAALIRLRDGFTVTALPVDRAGWGRLCRLLSQGRLRAEKGACDLGLDDLLNWSDGLHLLLHPQAPTMQRGAGGWLPQAQRLARRLGPDRAALLMAPAYDGADPARLDRLAMAAGCACAVFPPWWTRATASVCACSTPRPAPRPSAAPACAAC